MRDHAGRKGVRGLSADHEEVTHGFRLRNGDRGSDTADGAGCCGRPAQLNMDDWEEPGV